MMAVSGCGAVRRGPVSRGGSGVERWAFWKKRFGEIGGLEGAEGVVRRLAAEAEEEMGRIGMERAG